MLFNVLFTHGAEKFAFAYTQNHLRQLRKLSSEFVSRNISHNKEYTIFCERNCAAPNVCTISNVAKHSCGARLRVSINMYIRTHAYVYVYTCFKICGRLAFDLSGRLLGAVKCLAQRIAIYSLVHALVAI